MSRRPLPLRPSFRARRRTTAATALALGTLAALLGAGCHRPSDPPVPDVVAQVGDSVITVSELESELARQLSLGIAPSPSPARVLDDLIRHRILLTRARAEGIHERPETLRLIENLIVSRYEREHGPDLDALAAPAEADLQQAYQERLDAFTDPAQVRLGILLLQGSPKAGPEQRARLRQRAQDLRDLAATGSLETFAELVRLHSDDRATRFSAGETAWIPRPDPAASGWPLAVIQAGLALSNPGDVSAVIETPEACHLVQLRDLRPAAARPFAQVRSRLAHELHLERQAAARRAYEARLREGLPVVIHPESLARLAPSATPTVARLEPPPSMPAR
ncbi:MAG: peptidyl-prolyl cis-trans isomerase [Verrucomicrobiae bacterium]|nr:peptidyl-prolyl cis-trans isomerase [Verrucomicrobiae bacterium]